MRIIERDGSLRQEVAGAGPLPSPTWDHQRMGRVSTDVWAPGMHIVKQGLQAAYTGVAQQRVLLQENETKNKFTSGVHVRFCYQWFLVLTTKKKFGFQNNLYFIISDLGLWSYS